MGIVFKMMIPIIMMLLIYGYMMGGQQLLDFMEKAEPPKAKGIEGISNAVTDENVTVYQWVDDKGMKHFSSTPPEGKSVDALKLSAKANVIQSVKVPEKEEKPKASGGQVTSILKSPYSPGGAKAMIDQTTNLKSTLEQQMSQQQEMLDQITGQSNNKK